MKTRVFNHILSSDWAMLPDSFQLMLDIASGSHPGLKAVEAERGEELEYTYNVRVRDGVAIIPITGPIFRYANLFSYFSGGTSVSILARDFNAALNDTRVHSIIFEINSPGGEVTGISELANMIFNARGRKPMTARVGGHCCSAAMWIASACDDIRIDDTAILGSIGVYAAFLDTKKADAKDGFRRIKIVSNQSPNKVPDPATPDGEKLIQARVDALADVFVQTVARNRGVSVATVLSDYGRGDVFVGQAAVAAGLADRMASLEETIAELAAAHGPAGGQGYTGALYGEEAGQEAGQQTEFLIDADSQGGAPRGARSDEQSAQEDEPEEDDLSPARQPECDPEDGESDDGAKGKTTAQTPATTETQKGTMQMATENNSTTAGADNPTTVEALQAALAASQAQVSAIQEQANSFQASVARLEADALLGRLNTMAANFTGDKAAKVGLMQKMVANFGENSEELKAYVADQNAMAEQVRAGGLFRENGSAGGGDNADSALGKLNALAKERAKEKGLSFAVAFSEVCSENTTLYRQYDAERRR